MKSRLALVLVAMLVFASYATAFDFDEDRFLETQGSGSSSSSGKATCFSYRIVVACVCFVCGNFVEYVCLAHELPFPVGHRRISRVSLSVPCHMQRVFSHSIQPQEQ